MECIGDLEYRGEGNCAIVFANPKKRQVYRLVKRDYTKTSRTKLKSSSRGGDESFSNNENIDTDVRSKLEDTVSYVTNIMDPLLSFCYAVIPKLISIPRGFGEEAVKQTEDSRPAHRKKSWRNEVDPDIYTGLVLSDCCFVRTLSKSNHIDRELRISQDFCSETKSSDGRNFSSTLPCSSSKYNNTHIYHESLNSVTKPTPSSIDGSDTLCYDNFTINNVRSYSVLKLSACCCDAFSKTLCDIHSYKLRSEGEIASEMILDQGVVSGTTQSCPFQSPDNISVDLSGHRQLLDSTMSFSSSLPSLCKRSSTFTLSFEIKPKKAFRTVSQKDDIANQVCRFCMHKYLKSKRGKWPDFSSYCPLDLFSGDKKRMKHALISLIKTPQNNLKICKNGSEIYGSDIRQDLPTVLRSWFPDCHEDKRPRLISSFINLIIEILLRVPKGEATALAKEISLRRAQVQDSTVQICSSSSYVHPDKESHTGLPIGCVLERIQSIQALDIIDIDGIYPLYSRIKRRVEEDPTLKNKWCLDGPYTDVSWLRITDNTASNRHPESDEYAVLKLKQFLVSKTLQDCSIIAAIQPVCERITSEDSDVLWFEGHMYRYSISLVDLEPKSFDKVMTYFKQASEIADSFAESSLLKSRDTVANHNGKQDNQF